jgi:uncharacterized protein (UPF0276 family)
MELAAGVGFKAEYFEDALAARAAGLWFEVHAENYMVPGGPRLAMLGALRSEHPIAFHGVGMSLASDAPPDSGHLKKLASLADRFEPALVSEHLAWSTLDGIYYPDLLPIPRNMHTLASCVANISRVQDALGRSILIENPSHYLPLSGHELDECDFLAELAIRSGCGLLIDVNNVAVGANNLGYDARSWLDQIPPSLVGEIHLAGHSRDADGTLLIDSHDEPVSEQVWDLYESLIARIGARPTMVERDGNLPPFEELMAERNRAQALVEGGLALAA